MNGVLPEECCLHAALSSRLTSSCSARRYWTGSWERVVGTFYFISIQSVGEEGFDGFFLSDVKVHSLAYNVAELVLWEPVGIQAMC